MSAPTRPVPKSHQMLSRWADGYARQIGEDVARVRRWVAYMALGGALERAGFYGDGPRFIIKGGVALELRLRTRARATRDLDLIVNHPRFSPSAGRIRGRQSSSCRSLGASPSVSWPRRSGS